MIIVFVIDTSPSMARPAGSMSRLDVAKMVVEDLSRVLKKRQGEHSRLLVQDPSLQRSIHNLGQKGRGTDAMLLLSTSRQYPETAACGAGGRLLVGFGSASNEVVATAATDPESMQQHERMESFQRELKSLKAAKWDPNSGAPFPEDAGGAVGLNAALSSGLQLLSRYRLQNRLTENFGMGRLPNAAITMSNGSPATAALQPACLVLVTDGACLRQPPKLGGGSLQLHFGSQPLREFYTEPFRWDQRIFCLGVGGRDGVSSSQYLHPQLRALCEVTGGSHWMIRNSTSSSSNLQAITEALMQRIRPPLPRELPLPDPLFQRLQAPTISTTLRVTTVAGSCFVNGGPVCCFQALEMEEGSRTPVKLRAMLLYSGAQATMLAPSDASAPTISPPLWFFPEAFFPSKKLDTLTPRMAQPLLFFSKYPANLGSKSFEPLQVTKMLHRLDQLITSNRKLVGQQPRLLHRDVYICEWLSPEGGKPVQVSVSSRQEYFPVLCRGAGRPTLSEDASESFINIGILHVPLNSSTLASGGTQQQASRLATLTLLPPDPHLLLPLLIRAAEMEHRALKKAEATLTKQQQGNTTNLLPKQIAAKAMVTMDEQWRSEFRAYVFRLPSYYQFALKRALRPVLPSVTHGLLPADTADAVMLQCFSNKCLQKIRTGEQVAREMNERLERQEASLKRRYTMGDMQHLRYGQFDPRSSTESYLAAIRGMPAPWKVISGKVAEEKKSDGKSDISSVKSDPVVVTAKKSALDVLGDLPASCLMAYYESRRRWIFGGPSLSTRGLHADGVPNSGSNSHRCGTNASETEECLLTLGDVGVSTMNRTTTHKMGDYRERLLFTRSPVVGYGSNDAAGVAATTAVDGSPRWSVDNDAMPMTFFNPKTGEFADSVQARVRSRLQVNFGNPYKEKRADSLIPEKFLSQAPSMQQGGFGSAVGSPRTPPGSPPHDSFDSMEEGEAIFVRTSPSRSSPKREEPEDPTPPPAAKKPRSDPGVAAETKPLKPPAPPKPSAGAPVRPPSKSTAAVPLPPKNEAAAVVPPPPKPSAGTPAPPGKPAPGSLKRTSSGSGPLPPPPKPSTGTPTPLKGAPPSGTPTLPKTSAPPPPIGPPHTSKVAPSNAAKPPPPRGPKKGPPPPPGKPTRPPPPKPPSGTSEKRPSVNKGPRPPGSSSGKPPVPRPPEGTSTTPNASPVVQKKAFAGGQDSASFPKKPLDGQQDAVLPVAAKIVAQDSPAVPQKVSVGQAELQNPDKKPIVDLPSGWMCVWSKSQRRWYFFDTKTNKSVWEWPPP